MFYSLHATSRPKQILCHTISVKRLLNFKYLLYILALGHSRHHAVSLLIYICQALICFFKWWKEPCLSLYVSYEEGNRKKSFFPCLTLGKVFWSCLFEWEGLLSVEHKGGGCKSQKSEGAQGQRHLGSHSMCIQILHKTGIVSESHWHQWSSSWHKPHAMLVWRYINN